MNLDDLKKTIEEIEQKKVENYNQSIIYDERNKMSKVNQIDNKLELGLGFVFLPFGLLSCIAGPVLAKFIESITILNVIFGTISLGIGFGTWKLLEKLAKTKERIKSFSTAKTEAEKIEEEIFYKIELEKTNNRNTIYQKIINSLISRGEEFELFSKETTTLQSTTLKEDLKVLSEILEKRYKDLDELTAQKVLCDSFWQLRKKEGKTRRLVTSFILGGGISTALTTIALIPYAFFANMTINSPALFALVPLAVGSLVAGGYSIINNKNREKAFDKLNSSLGFILSKETKDDYVEQNLFNTMLETTINEIVDAEIRYYECKRNIEAFEEEEKQETQKFSIPPLTIEETRIYQQESPSLFVPDLSTEKTTEIVHEDGPKLTRKNKSNNSN